MEKENDLQYLRRRLDETVGQHNSIAEKSGVPQSTVSRIHKGDVPRLDTAIKLIGYLKKLDRSAVANRSASRRVRARALASPTLGN